MATAKPTGPLGLASPQYRAGEDTCGKLRGGLNFEQCHTDWNGPNEGFRETASPNHHRYERESRLAKTNA